MTLESYISHSIINFEQACVLTELTHSKSYLIWDKQSYILQATTQLMATWPPLASQLVSSKWAILTKRFVMEYVKKVCLLVKLCKYLKLHVAAKGENTPHTKRKGCIKNMQKWEGEKIERDNSQFQQLLLLDQNV